MASRSTAGPADLMRHPAMPVEGRPKASSPEALARMRRQARRDTSPELALRRELHRRGHRFRVDKGVLPGLRRRQDVVFSPQRVVVDVRGCYWHACAQHGSLPRANGAWWAEKLATNVARDRDTETRLHAAGWRTVVVWEHEGSLQAADRVEAALRGSTEFTGDDG